MINKCLFPAAGYGTRFLPATKSVPKEMLPILTKPLLQYGVEEALSAGIKNMAIVTGRGKRAIEDHFDNSYELESQLNGTSKEHLLEEINEVINKSTFFRSINWPTYIKRNLLFCNFSLILIDFLSRFGSFKKYANEYANEYG